MIHIFHYIQFMLIIQFLSGLTISYDYLFTELQNMNQEILDSLEETHEKWINSDYDNILDQVRLAAENILEENRQLDSQLTLFNKRIKIFEKTDEKNLPLVEFGRTIRMFQKEIEKVSDRISKTTDIIISLKSCLNSLPNILPLLEDAYKLLENTPSQYELIKSLRSDLELLKTQDEEIESIENQIHEIKKKRDLAIGQINDEITDQMEQEKSYQINDIIDSINNIENQKKFYNEQIEQFQNEMIIIDRKITEINTAEQENIKIFLSESAEIESNLISTRKSLDELRKKDLTNKQEELKNELHQKRSEFRYKQNFISSLQTEFDLLKNQTNNDLENEVLQLEDRLREAEADLESAPSKSEYKEILLVLQQYQNNSPNNGINDSNFQTMLSNLENNLNNAKKELSNLNNKLNLIQYQIEQKTKDYSQMQEQNHKIVHLNDENAIVEVLKSQKKGLNIIVAQNENEIQNLQREQSILDSRIRSLKDEKESIFNYLTSNGGTSMIDKQEIRRNNVKKMSQIELFILKITHGILSDPKISVLVIMYFILLHILAIFVIIKI
ncbi:hypothetical protein TRFO_20468 [Tritrichomonas foetus]|uniref:Uncharacterized protein n=1 Tax=Tritrichomonas foetus TaxID=1144522 RepID=A0A1J4KGI5_9EUKA|nr:hypothetical protein TRFO_20468 [Tritrichomonas foetus]|eukprot:OHT10331.1 hypothetical protein TRFO_20468 [Tritrichomonas foetus]